MERKKILIAHSWTDVSINIQTKKVAYALSNEADVLYFTQARVGKAVTVVNEHLTVMEWPNKRPSSFKDLFFCIRQIRQFKPDAVIVHFGATKIVMLASWLMGVKNRIAWYHTLAQQMRIESGNWYKAAFNLFVRRIAYFFATKVVTLNSYGAFDAEKHQHIAKKKIVVIANGMDVAAEPQDGYSYNSEKIKFLYVGRLTESKGSEFIVRVFAEVVKKYSNVVLQMVGGGDSEAALKKLVKALGVGDRIIINGPTKNYTEVFTFFKQAYALVVPSKMDNFPTVVIEGMAYGLPVVASGAGGLPAMVQDGKDGFLCGFGDTQQWLEKIEWLVNNPAGRNEMSATARQSYQDRFTLNRHVNNVVRFLKELGV